MPPKPYIAIDVSDLPMVEDGVDTIYSPGSTNANIIGSGSAVPSTTSQTTKAIDAFFEAQTDLHVIVDVYDWSVTQAEPVAAGWTQMSLHKVKDRFKTWIALKIGPGGPMIAHTKIAGPEIPDYIANLHAIAARKRPLQMQEIITKDPAFFSRRSLGQRGGVSPWIVVKDRLWLQVEDGMAHVYSLCDLDAQQQALLDKKIIHSGFPAQIKEAPKIILVKKGQILYFEPKSAFSVGFLLDTILVQGNVLV